MICPKCSTEIPDGNYLCPNCGEEVIVVSDFDIKLEDNIDTTVFAKTSELPDINIEGATTELPNLKKADNEAVGTKTVIDTKPVRDRKKLGKVLIALIIAGSLVICACITLAVVGIVRYYSFDYQFNRAQELLDSGNMKEAVKTAKHATTLDKDERARLLLADIYIAESNYDAAIAVLVETLEDFPDDVSLYDRIVACYENEGNYSGIHSMIASSGNSTLASRYSDYVSIAPEFSLPGGTYVQPDSVKLVAVGGGSVYYTTDGSIPTKDSFMYQTPIPLEEGITTITAIYINEKGIASEPVSQEYNVSLPVIADPVLTATAGQYTTPKLIGIKASSDVTVYYTTDGSDPDASKNVYEHPMLMPIGKSTFKFVAIDGLGISSNIVTAEYNLTLPVLIDQGTAELAISFQLTASGENVLTNEYKAKSGYADEGHTYYIIDEYNNTAKTGRTFAVDILTGQLYKVGYSEEQEKYIVTPL